MSPISMKPMLAAARRDGYAAGTFDIVDYNSARAVVRAAEQLPAPVTMQTSVKTVRFWGAPAIASWLRDLAVGSPLPVALHLHHCTSLDAIESCIAACWTSTMIDAPAKQLEQNLQPTKPVLHVAEPAGVGVEAELGEIGRLRTIRMWPRRMPAWLIRQRRWFSAGCRRPCLRQPSAPPAVCIPDIIVDEPGDDPETGISLKQPMELSFADL
ncbi:MAG: class II fructose-bisphosphate aldolase [Acidobacteria bacterium]|nr:class II fructose-bisphosphate aldolase [Acidobacteriota bacterium]